MQLRIAPRWPTHSLGAVLREGNQRRTPIHIAHDGDGPAQIKLAEARAEGQRIRALARAGLVMRTGKLINPSASLDACLFRCVLTQTGHCYAC